MGNYLIKSHLLSAQREMGEEKGFRGRLTIISLRAKKTGQRNLKGWGRPS